MVPGRTFCALVLLATSCWLGSPAFAQPAPDADEADTENGPETAGDETAEDEAPDSEDETSDETETGADEGDDGSTEPASAPTETPKPSQVPPVPGQQALPELDEASSRPPLPPPIALPEPPKWERRLEIGGGVVFVNRPLLHEATATAVSYQPTVGFGLHLRWDILKFLRVHPYFIDARHDLTLPAGALTTSAGHSISSTATLSESTAYTFVFGLRLEPTWWLSDRARAWASVGVGWGRFEIPEMTINDPTGGEFMVRERANVFVEFPMGLGVAFDVIPRWLAVEYEFYAAPITGTSGDALESYQAIDASGNLRDVGTVEDLDASFVHTIGLALIL